MAPLLVDRWPEQYEQSLGQFGSASSRRDPLAGECPLQRPEQQRHLSFALRAGGPMTSPITESGDTRQSAPDRTTSLGYA